jgi:hypothetical protein
MRSACTLFLLKGEQTMKAHTLNKLHVLLVFSLLALLLLAGVGSAAASDIRTGDSLVIGSGEVIDDDLLLFANTITVNGTVNGDLIAFATTITLNGTVNGSSVIAGQTLRLNGIVKGTLYGGGTSMFLGPNAVVERNMMFGGFSLQADPGSVVRRDLTMGGMQATLNGKIDRDLLFAGQALELNGEIGRNVRAEVSEPGQFPTNLTFGPNAPAAIPPGLRVSRDAKIGGQLSYASAAEQANAILGQPAGGVVFQQLEIETQAAPVVSPYAWLWPRLRDFFTVLIIGALALWLIPKWVNTSVEHAHTKPLASTAWGLVMLIAAYLIAIVAIIAIVAVGIVIATTTLGGLSAALLGVGLSGFAIYVTLFTALALWGTKVIVACLTGTLLLHAIAKQSEVNRYVAFVVGLVLFEIVAAIPVLGPIVTFVVILLGLGAMWYVYYERRKTTQMLPTKPAPMPA